MPAKYSGTRGSLYRRTPQIITALGYLLGFAVLLGAAATVVVDTTIMVSTSGDAEANVAWMKAEAPTLVRHIEVSPGTPVRKGAPLVRLIDSPEEVRRARSLSQLSDALEGLVGDADALPAQAVSELTSAIAAQSAQITERVVVSPVAGWAVFPTGSDAPPPGEPYGPGRPFAGIANLDRVTFHVAVSDTRPPTLQPGEEVPLLLGDWDAAEVQARAERIQAWVELELSLSALAPDEARSIQSATAVRLLGVSCSAEAAVNRETASLKVFVEKLLPKEAGRIRVGRTCRVALEQPGAAERKARVNAVGSDLTLVVAGNSLPDPVRRTLAEGLQQGRTRHPVGRAWVGTRRTSLFARLFGK